MIDKLRLLDGAEMVCRPVLHTISCKLDVPAKLQMTPVNGGYLLINGIGCHIYDPMGISPDVQATYEPTLTAPGMRLPLFALNGAVIRPYVKWEPPPPTYDEEGNEVDDGLDHRDPNYMWMATPIAIRDTTVVEVVCRAPVMDNHCFQFSLWAHSFTPRGM